MHRKKVDKFIFTIDLLVVVISIVASLNTTWADLNNSPPTPGHSADFKSIIKSLDPHGKDPTKREKIKDDDDSEEINELSRLQDPSSQEGRVDSSINADADTEKNNLFSPGSQANVPSDQKETNSDVLANMTDFLKEKEDIANDPVDGDFTPWTSWSSCPDTCGRTALRSRERYCTNPAPANGGKNCEGPRFQLKLCKIKHCPVDGSFSSWSKWSSCSQNCGQGMKHRHRYCDSPKPSNGGQECRGAHKQAKPCYGRHCKEQDSIVDIDPQTVCGYDPCRVAKCILLPYATCVSDFKCRPVFFDSEERKVSQCAGDNLYLNVDPKAVCRFDPCKYTTCLKGTAAKCVVNTRCHPVFLDAFGKRIKCKGVFKVPARYICGYDPCSGAICKSDPTARCLVDHSCNSIFVNSFNQRMGSCKARNHIVKEEDDAEEETNEDNADDDDDDDRLRKLMNSKTRGSENESDDNGDTSDDGDRLNKLIHSKLSVRYKDNDYNNDDDNNGDGTRLSNLLNSKAREQTIQNEEDDESEDDASRLHKLMTSKVGVSDEEIDSDQDKASSDSDKDESDEDDNGDKKSKLPSRFKLSKPEDIQRKKKNRFGHHVKYSKHTKVKRKRWLKKKN
ncbi:thrombospondin-1-like isoform X1 [Acropora millepora]|uniref:thrombospondin-1-like isoform X1 n=1 Tax=Acropora millepora TaxID=45264 RepID=UPI001CF2C210|nr:thrombospondin-1-like isoform X1 [Acropora millepora]